MSDNRKILTAKRKEQRQHCVPNSVKSKQDNNNINNVKKGIKRPVSSSPKKNLANDRLKKLRTALNEEVQSSSNQSHVVKNRIGSDKKETAPSRSSHARKRPPPSVNTRDISVTKMPRSNLCDSQIFHSSILLKSDQSDSAHHGKAETGQKRIFSSQRTAVQVSAANSINANSEEVMEWSPSDVDQPSTAPNSSNVCNRNLEYLYIVVDTNIFISQMQIIRNIVEMDITGMKKPVIFIPWIVIEELDFFKEDSSKNGLHWKAQQAIKYIEKALSENNERIKGQTVFEAHEQKDTGKSQDNKIISCCLQVLTNYKHMILLTNDYNLRNKARINHIPVCSHKEIVNKITVTLNNQTKSQIILEKMTSLFNTVIKESAQKTFGNVCNKMPICDSLPTTIQDCCTIFNKYWFTVFEETLLKQCKKSINDLSSFLINNNNIQDESKELTDLSRLCVRVCIFLKDIDSCKSTVEKTISEINNIKIS